MWHFRIWFSRQGVVGWMVCLDHLKVSPLLLATLFLIQARMPLACLATLAIEACCRVAFIQANKI